MIALLLFIITAFWLQMSIRIIKMRHSKHCIFDKMVISISSLFALLMIGLTIYSTL